MMEKINPILSTTLAQTIESIFTKTKDPIAKEISEINRMIDNFNTTYRYDDCICNIIYSEITNRISSEVSMIAVRMGDFEVSFLPEGKEPEYNGFGNWSRKNRQTGKPGRIFQKLLKKEFKQRDWEIFINLFKSELCQCFNFELVSGEDIRKWYLDENYYKIAGTLGNSCMRYDDKQPFFDIYVDNAQMLITTQDGLLTGRAIVWNVDGVVLLDRIYTCFDYLTNCFIDFAKNNKWWIRDTNSLLYSGDTQRWLSPDDDYTKPVDRKFFIDLKERYEYFPYMDSFRYYDYDLKRIYTYPGSGYTLDSTDGGSFEQVEYVCQNCGEVYYGTNDDIPDGIHYSDWIGDYLCDDCCWWCDEISDYIPNNEETTSVHTVWGEVDVPTLYLQDNAIECTNDASELVPGQIYCYDGQYFKYNRGYSVFDINNETNTYEIRPDSN